MDQLEEYFCSERLTFTVPLAAQGTSFQQQVWQQLRAIPYGQTCCYSDIAANINNPKAVRAVGAANGKNPISIMVPCHRVIGANGTLTGYAGGLEAKSLAARTRKRATSGILRRKQKLKLTELGELIALGAIWGASFLFMRTATPEFGAIALVVLRTGIAALVLFPALLMARKYLDLKQHWWAILVVGLINTAIPFTLFSYATVHLGAGFGSILNATAPMFGAVIAFIWLKDSLSNMAIIGLFVGFCGVAVISAERSGIELELAWLPIGAALAATCAYGLAACFTKKHLGGVSTLAIATGSQAFAALALIPLVFFNLPEKMPSTSAWLQVLTLGVLCTAVAYILYFRLIANIGAARAITVAYLVPVFGVLWGIIFLGEVLTPMMILGASLILVGVAMTTGLIKLPKKAYV